MIGELNPIEHRAETLDAPMIDLVARYRDYPFVFKPLPILEKWETIDPSDDPNVLAIAKQARCFELSDEITFLIWSTDSNDYVFAPLADEYQAWCRLADVWQGFASRFL